MIATTALAMLLAGGGTASADDPKAFVAKLAGTWEGGGTITTDASAAPGPTNCRLDGAIAGDAVNFNGACDGAARGAKIYVALRWNDPTQQFVGEFLGGTQTGTAKLSGKLAGNTLSMQVTAQDGSVSRLVLQLSGERAIDLKLTGTAGGKPVTFVTLGLRKA
jgi:hypothetical protein